METITTDTLELTKCVVDCLLDYTADDNSKDTEINIEKGPGSLWNISVPKIWGSVLHECERKCRAGEHDNFLV